MCQILWNTDVNAPCCPGEIVQVLPKGQRVGRDEDTGRFVAVEPASYLAQVDFEYPSIAQSFGWSLREVQQPGRESCPCDHSTDGSVKCLFCGLEASDFISAAYDWLQENDGVTADDPGYFGGDSA